MRYFYDADGDESEEHDDDPERARAERAAALDEDDAHDRGDTDDEGDLDDDADDDLDDAFPRGDGTADTAAVVSCPYCGELNDVAVDPGSGSAQAYIEDCQVCCRPWRVTVTYDSEGRASAYVEAADDL
jgi:hypothetical protein